MARGPVVNVTVTGDARKAQDAFRDTGRAADRMEDDISEASRRTRRSLDDIDRGAGNTERGFRGLNDGIGGSTALLGTFGVAAGGTVGKVGDMVQGFTDLAGFVGDFATQIPGLLTKMGILTTTTAAQTAATGAQTTAQYALNTAFLANPIFLVVAAIAALTLAFVLAWKNSETFREIVTGAFNTVKGVIEGVYNWVRDNWPLLLAILTGPFGLAVLAIVRYRDDIVRFIKEVPAKLTSALSTVKDIVVKPFELARDGVDTAVGAVVELFSALPGNIVTALGNLVDVIKYPFLLARDGIVFYFWELPGKLLELWLSFINVGKQLGEAIISGVKSGLTGLGSAIIDGASFVLDLAAQVGDAIRYFVNVQVIDRVNRALEIKISGGRWLPDISINPPDIPHLAMGGIVNRPTLALIGEAGPEAVVPLGRGRGGLGDIYLTVNAGLGADGRTIGQQIRQVLVEERRRVGSGLGLG